MSRPKPPLRARAEKLDSTLVTLYRYRVLDSAGWEAFGQVASPAGKLLMANPLGEARIEKSSAPGRVLLVDDQPELRRLFRRNLSKIGHVVVEAWNGRVALDLVQQLSFDVVISDVHMPDMSGIELLEALRELEPDLPVVLTSGSPGGAATLEAGDLGAYAYLVKPVSFDTMREAVAEAIDIRRARAAAKELFEPYCSVERLRVPRPDGYDDDH